MDNLKKYLVENGASAVKYAFLSGIPSNQRNYFDFGISIGVALNPKVIKSIQDGPNVLYQKEYTRVNQLLNYLGKLAVDYIREKGYQAHSLTSTISTQNNNLVDLSTPLPHKTVATIAGMGWIGKSALLVTKEYGAAIRLTTVLTNMSFGDYQEPISISFCGECKKCVEACPANAISGKNWHLGMDRDDFYSAVQCKNKISRIIQNNSEIKDLICGKCIVVCPWTKKYLEKSK